MTKIEIVKAGERIVQDITTYVSQPTSPVTAQPVNVGLVEISQSQPTQLIPGPVGPQGPRGSVWTTGDGPPSSVNAGPGDMYLDDTTGDIWTWDGTAWVNTGTEIEGPTGPQGVPGPPNALNIGTVTTVPVGGAATSTITGTPPVQTLNLGLPTGATGATGAQGIQGNPGTAGATGPANTLAIGTVTTVPVGGAATSTITGTAPNQTLNLGLPTGATGAASTVPGPAGPTGSTGPAGPTGGATIDVADTPPTPIDNRIWFESDTGNTYVRYNDGNTTQWVQINAGAMGPQGIQGPQGIEGPIGPQGIPGGATAQTRNRVINGAMQISQERYNTAGTAGGYYAADQFYMNGVYGGTITVQRVQVPTPNGSTDRFRLTVTVADASLAATDHLYIRQIIEGSRVADFRYGSAAAKQSILRFGFKGPAGTYSLSCRNSASDRSFTATFTIAAGQANTDTEQIIVIPGDTTGTWLTDTGVGLVLNFCLACGTTYQGVAGWQAGNFLGTAANTNGMATAGNIYELYDVGLYLDPLNTGNAPQWEMPDEAQELTACQRYWQSERVDFNAYGVGAIPFTSRVYFATYMRAVVAITGAPTSIGNCTLQAYDINTVSGFRCYVVITATGSFYFASVWVANARL